MAFFLGTSGGDEGAGVVDGAGELRSTGLEGRSSAMLTCLEIWYCTVIRAQIRARTCCLDGEEGEGGKKARFSGQQTRSWPKLRPCLKEYLRSPGTSSSALRTGVRRRAKNVVMDSYSEAAIESKNGRCTDRLREVEKTETAQGLGVRRSTFPYG